MTRWLALWLVLAAAGNSAAQIAARQRYAPYEPIVIEVEDQARPGQTVNALWTVDAPAKAIKVSPTVVHVWAPPQATAYAMRATVWITQRVTIPQPDGSSVDGDLLIGPPRDYDASFLVTGTPEPSPQPPTPEPQPPDPPQPNPGEFGPSPFTGEGLRVLIIYEHDDLAKYPATQFDQLGSLTLRTWMRENAAKDSSGNVQFRCVDQHAVAIPTVWQDAMQRQRSSLPWLIAGNGHVGYEGKLPESEEKTLDLLERLQRAR